MSGGKRVRGFFIGFFLGLIVPILALLVAARRGWIPISASARPPAWESRISEIALDAGVTRQAPRWPNPIPATDAELLSGLKLYRNDCAGCHGDFGKPADWGKRFYPPVPQFSDDPPRKPDWQIFWIIRNGVRRSGMGGWAGQVPDADIWRLAAFLARLEKLPPEVDAQWRKPPPS
jgi:thiosulfate dehydrogenase